MSEFPLHEIAPEALSPGGEGGSFPVTDYPLRFLAQGDSWFSLNDFPPSRVSNLLHAIELPKRAFAVNCARPGKELAHMTDTTREARFVELLVGKSAWKWNALLLSGLGNDVISAMRAPPTEAPQRRLLRQAADASGAVGQGPERYVSEEGWAVFAQHARRVFADVVALRQKGINRDIPIVVHTYDRIVPHEAGLSIGHGAWLTPTMRAYGIVKDEWAALSDVLLRRVRQLILDIASADPSVLVVDTYGTLNPAGVDDVGATVDWRNEIHPSGEGYGKLGKHWSKLLSERFV